MTDPAGSDRRFETAIVNGTVLKPDSSGFHEVNLGIREDRIEAITAEDISADRLIDAQGLIVSPGFVDVHSHVDQHPYAAKCAVRMGVTTCIGNNCGMGIYPLSRFEEQITKEGFPINQGLLVGHQDLRLALGCDDRYQPLDTSKLDNLCRLADEALDWGALGISFGLAYVPRTSTEELIGLAQVAADHNSILTAHPRYAGRRLPGGKRDAVTGEEELISAVRTTGTRLQISHLGSQIAWRSEFEDDLLKRGIECIENACNEGVDITADCHPYDAWCTYVGAAALDAFQRREFREYYRIGFDVIEVAEGPYRGTRLTEELYHKLRDETPEVHVVGHMMREDLVVRTLQAAFVMVASDASFGEGIGRPSHPRSCGTFPRVLRRLVRELDALSLETALFKMTLMPAQRFGLVQKGRIAAGADADLVIFDPGTVTDRATYTDPDQGCKGIRLVLVNGVPVVENDQVNDNLPGRLLHRQ